MAGHRRVADAVPAPTLRRTRRDRRRERLAEKWATTTSPKERLELAHDYLRGAAARRNPHQARVDELLEEFAEQLVAAGDRVLGWQAGERLTPATTSRKETAA